MKGIDQSVNKIQIQNHGEEVRTNLIILAPEELCKP